MITTMCIDDMNVTNARFWLRENACASRPTDQSDSHRAPLGRLARSQLGLDFVVGIRFGRVLSQNHEQTA
jgi:hypothetical protein